MRLKDVIAKRMLHPDRRLALDLLLRVAAAALSAGLILGLLPAITQAAA
jgi:flagellar biosynthesis protein FliQ